MSLMVPVNENECRYEDDSSDDDDDVPVTVCQKAIAQIAMVNAGAACAGHSRCCGRCLLLPEAGVTATTTT